MKTILSEFAYFIRGRVRRNLKVLLAYCTFLSVLVLLYAVLFQHLMLRLEGREYSIIAGIYWAITVMTTLGFGDITFHSDPGFIFATIVTLSGVLFLLIILPFGMVSLFLAPWIEDRLRYRVPAELPEDSRNHVIIVGLDPITRAFIRKLRARGTPFVVVSADYDQVVRLDGEERMPVVFGDASDPRVLENVRVRSARLVVANMSDAENTNILLTVRSLCNTPVVAVLAEPEHANVLGYAGADHVIPLARILGRYLATRATTKGAMAHVLDSMGSLLVAEFPVYGTPFAGISLKEAAIRRHSGLAVIGIWQRGSLAPATPDTVLSEKAVMMVVGTREELERMERLTGEKAAEDKVLILGHGRIGCSAAGFLDQKPVPYTLLDQGTNPFCTKHVPMIGDATIQSVLRSADIGQTKGLIVTTNDDSTNIFLTLSARHMNPHIRIVARANQEQGVEQLYAAGADFVVSNASVGASILNNILEGKESIFLSEGVHIFRQRLPGVLVGSTIESSGIRSRTGCSVIALEREGGEDTLLVPPPETELTPHMRLIMIGSPEQEALFKEVFH